MPYHNDDERGRKYELQLNAQRQASRRPAPGWLAGLIGWFGLRPGAKSLPGFKRNI